VIDAWYSASLSHFSAAACSEPEPINASQISRERTEGWPSGRRRPWSDIRQGALRAPCLIDGRLCFAFRHAPTGSYFLSGSRVSTGANALVVGVRNA
jgi:hypothetical protein